MTMRETKWTSVVQNHTGASGTLAWTHMDKLPSHSSRHALGFSILFVKTEIRSNGDWELSTDLEVCAC